MTPKTDARDDQSWQEAKASLEKALSPLWPQLVKQHSHVARDALTIVTGVLGSISSPLPVSARNLSSYVDQILEQEHGITVDKRHRMRKRTSVRKAAELEHGLVALRVLLKEAGESPEAITARGRTSDSLRAEYANVEAQLATLKSRTH